ncbi:MAG: 5-(carboxyamino)imidazole ribonucleotide synthase [Alphaproteobacteria bacterium]|nr:5-(carboxyamino)imidazole ribonucleotide synthase [Alphaproteobacteria bacterium]
MSALPPGSTIGILGGGQLGRMLAIAAARLGFNVHIYSDTSGPAFDVCVAHTLGAYDDSEAVAAWAAKVDVVTYEFENVPLAAAAAAASKKPVRPNARALEAAQDRLAEKRFLESLGLAVAPFYPVDDTASLASAIDAIGTPAILKTRRLGYDGKGQARIATPADAGRALEAIGNAPAILEGHVRFDCEISVLLARGIDGATASYDIPLNTHVDGILATSAVPGPLSEALAARAQEAAARIADALDYVGLIAVEMFYAGKNAERPLVVNEFAPRVHNSGHWTLDACAVCQFENHIRAVAGWPIAATARHSDAVMTNLIGSDVNDWLTLAGEPGACLHLYGKNEARPGRKMGHITRLQALSSKIAG